MKMAALLREKKEELRGDWILKNSSYEKYACDILEFECQTKRYWDAIFNDIHIEIKKGKSIWLDEVRYSEILLEINEEARIDTLTIFLIPSTDKTYIKNICLVNTKKIIEFMNINHEWATILINRKKSVKRCLNCQQSMTIRDLKIISDFII